jgi:hypothetical protein
VSSIKKKKEREDVQENGAKEIFGHKNVGVELRYVTRMKGHRN